MSRHNAFRDGKVHVCRRMCKTCIFRPGNPMNLEPGRVTDMVDEAVASQSAIICHSSLTGENAVCRGFFDHHPTVPLRLAMAIDRVEFDEPRIIFETSLP